MAVLLPVLVLVVASVGLAYRIEPFASWYFQWAWWSYLLAVDAVNHRLSGHSLLRDRPREFLLLSAVSVVFWTAFEAINFRLGNWYYVMDHPERVARHVGGALAFATVLPGILETDELLGHLGVGRRLRVPALAWTRSRSVFTVLLGAAGLALALVWPEVFFPLTWLFLAPLLEPFNRRQAPRSFVRELERGEAGPLVRVLLAGLVCGALWETWNYWARVKWVYTVPGFEELKLFEMPLLGFLGFPPFAVCCVVTVSALQALRERARRLAPAARHALAAGVAASATVSTLVVFEAAGVRTVDSFYVPVARLRVLPAADRTTLAAAGLESPECLLWALRDAEGRREWSARTGIDLETLRLHRERVALVMHRGLGEDRALQLEALGIRTRQDLVGWSASALASALRAGGARTARDRFLERRARVWLEGMPEGH